MLNRERSAEDDPDRRLVARVAAGDRAAFETLYHTYIKRVLSYARGMVRSDELAEEIAGDTMVDVWRSAPRFAGRARVLTWILAIAHHRAIDQLRRKRVDVVALDSMLEAVDPAGDPVESALRSGDQAAIGAALATLSAEHRAVLELTYAQDLSQAEIALIVNAPVATVKTRVFHAKRKLRAALERAERREGIQ